MNNYDLLSRLSVAQLEYAATLARLGSFGKAAAECGVSQPALSMQIRRLESTFGEPLFDRARQPIVPTELGRLVSEQARVILREVRRLPDLVDECRDTVRGTLRIGIIPTLAPSLLPRFLPRFVRDFPELTVVIEEVQTPEILARTADERLDAGLIAGCPPGPGIDARPLFEEPFVAYLPASHRLAGARRIDVRKLRAEEVLLLAEGHCLRDQVIELCGWEPVGPAAGRLNFASGNLETLKTLVERGAGLTLLPALSALDTRRRRTAVLRPFRPPVPSRTIHLVRHRVLLKTRAVDAFARALRGGLPGALRSL